MRINAKGFTITVAGGSDVALGDFRPDYTFSFTTTLHPAQGFFQLMAEARCAALTHNILPAVAS